MDSRYSKFVVYKRFLEMKKKNKNILKILKTSCTSFLFEKCQVSDKYKTEDTI